MLDDYKLDQNVIYKTIINSVLHDKLSHAYIIESNGFSKAFDFALSFVKYMMCPYNYTNKLKCNGCNQCINIDKNDYIELKIINPDSMWIKKNEMDKLQELFSRKSISGNKRVYIINQSEKLNASAANSILKFLEEPEDGIVAILIVEDVNMLLSTIVSRCQILSLKKENLSENVSTIIKIANNLKNNKEEIDAFINDEQSSKNIQNIINFIKKYEDEHSLSILYLNKTWNQFFKERNEINDAFVIMLLFYKDVLNILIERKIEYFNDYIDDLEFVANKNNKNNIISKIKIIIDLLEKIKYNINNNLLMDKLIIELEGCEF